MRKCRTKVSLKPNRVDYKCYSSVSDIKRLRRPYSSSFADCSTLLSLGLVSLSAALLGGIPQLRHLQHLGFSKAIQASLSQVHSMASLVLNQGPALPHLWPQQHSFLNNRGRFHILFYFYIILHDANANHRASADKFICLLVMEPAPLLVSHFHKLLIG